MNERFSLKIADYISDQLSEMTIEELEQVRIDCSRLTDTNCDWREYILAPYIRGRATAYINLKRSQMEPEVIK